MTMGSDGYFHPKFGPEKGQGLHTERSPPPAACEVRSSRSSSLFQADMKTIGVKINIQNFSANTLFRHHRPEGRVRHHRVRAG